MSTSMETVGHPQPTAPRGRVRGGDDDPDISLVCRLHLEGAGFEVHEAGTGIAGVDLARTWTPAAIVLDFMLPDLDGVQVVNRLHEDPLSVGIPVIMLTARTHERDQVAAWEAGVVDYITKPFDGDRLVEAVGAALAPEDPRRLELRRAEAVQRLRADDHQAIQQMAAIVESADDAVIGKSLAGHVLSWNSGAEKLYGWTAQEAIGQSLAMLAPPMHEDEIPAVLGRIERGERVPPFETPRQRRDGSSVHVSVTISPVHDSGGRVVGASAISRR